MKTNIILILICFLLFTIPGLPQFQIGPYIGTNLSGLNVEPDLNGRNINTKTGLLAGLIINYSFNSNIALQLEPSYTQKGALIQNAQTNVGLILEFDQTLTANYIDIPLLLKISFESEFITPYIVAGPNFAFKVGKANVKTDNAFANGENIMSMIPENEIEEEIETKDIDYGIILGAGFSFPTEFIDFLMQAQYDLGLNTIYEDQDVNVDQLKTKGLKVFVGILYSL